MLITSLRRRRIRWHERKGDEYQKKANTTPRDAFLLFRYYLRWSDYHYGKAWQLTRQP